MSELENYSNEDLLYELSKRAHNIPDSPSYCFGHINIDDQCAECKFLKECLLKTLIDDGVRF